MTSTGRREPKLRVEAFRAESIANAWEGAPNQRSKRAPHRPLVLVGRKKAAPWNRRHHERKEANREGRILARNQVGFENEPDFWLLSVT